MTSDSVFIIAEAGVNHNGNVEIAKKMIDAAAEACADAVKFQTLSAERMLVESAQKADYQKETTDKAESQFQMIKKLELSGDDHEVLMSHCRQRGILFLSSPFDVTSVDLLDELGLEMFKIPSGEIVNLPYLRKIGALKRKVILSTGMATISEVEEALDILVGAGTCRSEISVLHCTTGYPAAMADVNLRAMQTIARALDVRVGYSDHTPGIEIAVAAVAMGATIIEKHFTLDRNMSGPDHKASLEPHELRDMVCSIRNVEKALGDGKKEPSPSELRIAAVVRKSIVAAEDIKAGDIFSAKNLSVKRPGTGISPMQWDDLIGRHAGRAFKKDEMIVL